METGTHVRAIHQDGVLKLLTPLELPEGAQVSVIVLPTPFDQVDLVYPTRLVPAKKLDNLTGLVSIGGDALADSEALYD
jgi:predicted DNA-binding antitoxin AbrB/MazE fold protein